jgi:hypothetical protein
MGLDKYINWGDIWENEVCLKTAIDVLEDGEDYNEIVETIKQFQKDENVIILNDECSYDSDNGQLVFFFGETGGQNESDNQGWSREYIFIVDEDFMVIDTEYRQG